MPSFSIYAAAPQALKDWPCCNRATISNEKVENVRSNVT
jgi:hypothetical protein